jgi:hypothetical protein
MVCQYLLKYFGFVITNQVESTLIATRGSYRQGSCCRQCCRFLFSKCAAEIWKGTSSAPKVSVIVHGLLQTYQVINSVMLQPFLSNDLQFTSHKQYRCSDNRGLNNDSVLKYEDRSENKLTVH